MERRLAAILAADVVGYSRLMSEDETGTLERLKSLRKELVQPKITERKGRIVKLMGDGLLAEFPSVVEAVRCAIEIQQAMPSREAELPDERRIRLRIGVNLGDIIVEGSDIYGDGVNVAARLEALADPGGICISGPAFETVDGKLDIAFEDIGEKQVKNIAKPVRVYRLGPGSQQSSSSTYSAEPLPYPDKPSIAVLPFTNMSNDPEQEYFSDGITEDIITELSRFRSLFVIARNSSFHYKGQSPKVQDVGRELGVRYVVEGSVRKAGNRVRVTAQLVEAASGKHLWAERYDRELVDIFTLQDELVHTIVSTVEGRVETASQARAERLSETDLLAYDHVLRANAAFLRYDRADNAKAGHHARQAIALDPQNAQAHLLLAQSRLLDSMAHWVVDRDAALQDAYEGAKKAIEMDDSFTYAAAELGVIQVYRRDFDDARRSFERALALNPNDSNALGSYGLYLTAIGRAEEALAQFDLAARINPLYRDWIDWLKGIACFTLCRYEEAIDALRSINDPINEVRGWLAASYAGAGRLEEARTTLEEFLRVAEEDMAVFPGRKLAAWEDYWHGAIEYQDNADFEHLYDALRKAGLED